MKQGYLIFMAWLLLLTTGWSLEAEEWRIVPDRQSAIYEPGIPITFLISQAWQKKEIVYRVTDYNQQIVREDKTTNRNTLILEELPPGYYELSAICDVDNNSENDREKAVYPFAVIAPVTRSADQVADNPFGAMVMPHTAYPMADRRRDAEMMARIGLGFVRSQRLSWIQVQPGEDSLPDWDKVDEELEIYRQHGLGVIANVGWPLQNWASEGQGSGMRSIDKMFPAQEHLEALTAFYTELAQRCRGRVAFYEIGNEVDASLFWLGRLKNAKSGDHEAIIRDFGDYFTIIARALKAGDPEAKTGPNTTGFVPDGQTYRHWLTKFLSHPQARAETDFLSVHYRVDIPAVRRVFVAGGLPESTPLIFTELGGMAHISAGDTLTWDKLVANIRITYIHYANALAGGGTGLCKFLLRDIPNIPPQPWVAGMLTKDFRLRPEYVAFATLVRELSSARVSGELNLIQRSRDGWLQAYAYEQNNQQLTMLILNDCDTSPVTFTTPDANLIIIDPMGRERIIAAKEGQVELTLQRDTPLFVRGQLTPDPGPVKYPQPVLIETLELAENASFEDAATLNSIPGWKVITDEISGKSDPNQRFQVEIDTEHKHSGRQSLRMSAKEKTNWCGIMLKIPVSALPKLKTGEYIELTARYWIKQQNVNGIGTGATFSQRTANGRRLAWSDSGFEWGTYNWKERDKTIRINHLSSELDNITLEFYLGQATGTVWIDTVSLTANLWRQSAADARGVN